MIDWLKSFIQKRYFEIPSFQIPNPIGVFIYRRRVELAVRFWNRMVPTINEVITKKLQEANNNDEFYAFKWTQLVQQEIFMWIRLGEVVTQKELDEMCKRRGFDGNQRFFLINALMVVGLYETS